MASASAQVPTLSRTHDTINLLRSLHSMRVDEQTPLTTEQLHGIQALLLEYGSSPNRRDPPSKAELHEAVSALLHRHANKLSQKWNKGQLAKVLGQWVEEALLLPHPAFQRALYLEVKPGRGEPGVVFIQEDDGS